MTKALVLEGRILKRLSKKVKTEYMLLVPGQIWISVYFEGQRFSVIADEHNTSNLYVGQKK